jgi:hypothetical protein
MFSKFFRKIILSISSLSPVALTFWFKEFSKSFDFFEGLQYLMIFVLTMIISFLTIHLSESKLEVIKVKISTVQNSDNEVVSYIFAYILPLIGFDLKITLFIIFLYLFIVFTTNIYHFNPIIGLFGYHYYTISFENGTTFVLISKKTLMNAKEINSVVQLDDYTLLEVIKK